MIKDMSKEEYKNIIRSFNTALIAVLLLLYTMSSCTTIHQVSEASVMEIRTKEQKKQFYTEARIERKAARKYKLLNNYKNGYYKPYYSPYQSYSQDIYDMRPDKLRQEEVPNHSLPYGIR
jgi:hypothetical protein